MIQSETTGYDEQPVRDNTARYFAALVAVALLLRTATLLAAEPTSASLQQEYATSVAPFLKAYCLDCHGQTTQEAKLDLSSYRTSSDAIAAHQTWEIILDRLESAEMPPEDSDPQPTRQQRQTVIDWIRAARDFEARRNAGDPGPVLARRLSNAEYNYSIRDLTGIDIQPTKTFPVDPANEAGFDNTGESLTMSPALLRKYLAAARQVAEHLVLKPDGIAFAAHPVVTDTDRDKYCVRRIVDFYLQQPTDLADYFFAAWQYRHRDALGTPDASLSAIASEASVSPKYLSTVWVVLTDNTSETSVGPIDTLQQMWNELPTDHAQIDRIRVRCAEMRDFVVQLRQKLKPGLPNITVEGSHVGSQPFVLWKNRQYVAYRRSFDAGALQVATESANTESHTPQKQDGESKAAADPDLTVPADKEQQKRHEESFARFCSVFPDAFYISERGRDYVEEKRKQMGERGRLLSAGFHSMMGYFRDDAPLYEMILDEDGQQELDTLWQELDFIASAPMRQYVGFLWFERTDSRYMRDPQFDFARPEDKQSQTEPMIQKLAEVYLEKAIASGGGDVELGAIRHYFREINEQIRWVEQARVAAEPSHLKAILDFAQRAWRRQLSKSERYDLVTYYQSLRDTDGLSHEEAIHDTLVSVLMSPLFSYRVDLLGVGSGQRPLTDNELASRLSYFLWSSTPDDELLHVAATGSLQKPGELKEQVQRMLQDDRIRGLATEFGGNWLDFRRFEEHNSVDRNRFPVFTDDLRQAMFEEPIRFVVDVAQQNRSVLDFLYAKHTFVNAVLADHYGIPRDEQRGIPRTTTASTAEGDYSQADRRIWIQIDDATPFNRGGLLPMSVFLTKNAPGLRTSPVKRGYWVVRRLLGEHIPAPPPNVPELPQDESKLGDLTLREALAKHRENQACAGCHERFDSIGLAFEGFGPVGERRDRDLGGRPISTAATFPGGHDGSGLKDLQAYLRQHRQTEFVENLCRKLLSYALGRSLILSDELLVRDLVTRLKADDYRFTSLIQGIVTSPQFLTKRGGEHVVME
ncbi:MAG: DUF1592 domain-containing protein [Planctomycetota bacterium]|jgi:hypothetical protein